MYQIVQVAGALLVLIAFAASQFGWMLMRSPIYLALNLVGATVLAGVALVDQQWGFLMLETVWAFVSGWGCCRVLRGEEPAAAQ